MKETMVESRVTYTLEHDGKFFIVENVPARVCRETGEHFFSPETVDHIHGIIKGRRNPDRIIETPVYNYG
ncbi:MAG: YgiT-type zinc finger protein [Thermodesulfobacteriota bacterium]